MAESSRTDSDLRGEALAALISERLGIARLRSGQLEAVEAVLDGYDVVAVLPSGYGKSAIYQAAAALLPGATIVVSPLIALQQDQLDAIDGQASGGGAVINSSMSARERDEALAAYTNGRSEFLLLAPEQLANEDTLHALRRAGPSLFVVDEAHCIASWGHDFRPDYALLGTTIEALGRPRVIALSATAAPPVRDEIIAQLGLRSPRVVTRDLDRPNIALGVRHFGDETRKREAVVHAVVEAAASGIVYVATRARTEELAAALVGAGVPAAPYHGGMTGPLRRETQDAFMAGTCDVIVATTAFGMGVDKPDIRFVFHYEVSDSLDSYYQEIGRAGRDGEPAQATLFYRPEDLGIRRFFSGGSGFEDDELEAVLDAFRLEPKRHLDQVADELGLPMPRLLRMVNLLEPSGGLKLEDARTARAGAVDGVAAVEAAQAQLNQQHDFERTRVAMMQRYAEHRGCRRAMLLAYFGDEYAPPCNSCDNCVDAVDEARAAVVDVPGWLAVGSAVMHEHFGPGHVLEVEQDRVVIRFDEAGYRVIDIEAAAGLLSIA